MPTIQPRPDGHEAAGRAAEPGLGPAEPLAGEAEERHGQGEGREREHLAEGVTPRQSRARLDGRSRPDRRGRGDARRQRILLQGFDAGPSSRSFIIALMPKTTPDHHDAELLSRSTTCAARP